MADFDLLREFWDLNIGIFLFYYNFYFVFSPETDQNKIATGGDDSVQYQSVIGLDLPKPLQVEHSEDECSEDDESNDGDDSCEDEAESIKGFKSSRRPRDEDKDSKKERKQAVKDAKAEKRKDKVKKHVKKKKEQSGRGNTKK